VDHLNARPWSDGSDCSLRIPNGRIVAWVDDEHLSGTEVRFERAVRILNLAVHGTAGRSESKYSKVIFSK
jgi:hypothetical protein